VTTSPPDRGDHLEHIEEWKDWFVYQARDRAVVNFYSDAFTVEGLQDALEMVREGGGGFRFDAFVEFGSEIHVFFRIDKDIPFHAVYFEDGTFVSLETREV
jgi:hypothetical protein